VSSPDVGRSNIRAALAERHAGRVPGSRFADLRIIYLKRRAFVLEGLTDDSASGTGAREPFYPAGAEPDRLPEA